MMQNKFLSVFGEELGNESKEAVCAGFEGLELQQIVHFIIRICVFQRWKKRCISFEDVKLEFCGKPLAAGLVRATRDVECDMFAVGKGNGDDFAVTKASIVG